MPKKFLFDNNGTNTINFKNLIVEYVSKNSKEDIMVQGKTVDVYPYDMVQSPLTYSKFK